MPDISIPQARRIVVDTTGAQIVQEESPATRDSRGIYLPHYIEPVSYIAIDIGGSLAKVVYFTRSPHPIAKTPPETAPSSPFLPALQPNTSASAPSTSSIPATSLDVPSTTAASDGNGAASSTSPSRPHLNGALTPGILASDYHSSHRASVSSPIRTSTSLSGHPHLRRSSLPPPLPGGLLNFARFETEYIDDLIVYLQELIATSATANRVSLERMKSTVKVMATGGGAHKYYDRLRDELGVEVRREEEMECLILGLGFVIHIPEEVFWFSEELVYKVSHPDPAHPIELERPSPQPPLYHVTFAPEPGSGEAAPHFPCLVVNIGSGVSIVKVDEDGSFERVSGTSLGGGTLWGLLSLLTDANSFDEMLLLSEKGDNAAVDMLVGDIYGSDYAKIGLKSSTIASTFGKVFRKDSKPGERRKRFKQEDIAKSLLYAISNNIGHVAYMNAAKYGLDRVFFSGCFIRGHAATISTLSYAIRFWSKGTMRACFLRHEGFLGAIGAWIKNVQAAEQGGQGDQGESAILEDGDGPDGSGGTRPEEVMQKEK
ncbi:pantothenate kinase [Saitozyma sp. JCM 24511]|nr:pantothenate kinase [Saitozyma sp. JCM 24511]